MVKSLGICIGASTIKIAGLEWADNDYKIKLSLVKSHNCNPLSILKEIYDQNNLSSYDFVCVTGRKFKDFLKLPIVTEPEATEYALQDFLKKENGPFNALISLGSENFILYGLSKSGAITRVETGNKCASGTGEFFMQQISRMDVDIDSAIRLANESDPFFVSGRCSVFCKSDCTHALNRGIPAGKVCAGLGNMITQKVLELMRSTKKEGIIVVGGVTKNSYIIRQLKKEIKNVVIPNHSDIFEALGAALYAHDKRIEGGDTLEVLHGKTSFTRLLPLSDGQSMVTFKELNQKKGKEGDVCILGLDVGSTTTKAVLINVKDNSVIASVYLRTNGNPVLASRNCYAELLKQIGKTKIKIIGLGVTGSGRKIAGLHAQTDGVINEIIAHATAAAYFDKEVDTIIEIGGQDAKYTFLVNGVPCDYAMNEACSAGTGSFLEEAAKESLGIDYLDIQKIALKAKSPPNFNDQCAAFISSDIKNASHENINREDIVAGLVYSICMNYCNRVKGARRIGNKVFMQGGVCYNKAVPLAMAMLLHKEIIVPPEPGLMGAFGVALEAKDRIGLKLLEKGEFDLEQLSSRDVSYGDSFNCQGKSEKCDRGCSINMIKIDGKSYPFGGACNKYYNLLHHQTIDPTPYNWVTKRQELVFSGREGSPSGKTVGISKSFFVNTIFPLYHGFFTGLGMHVILSDEVEKEGIDRVSSSFCFPAEIAHGMFMNLLKKNPDYIFLPQIKELFVGGKLRRDSEVQATCVLAQAEPYYIKSAFKDIKPTILSPVFNFSKGWESGEDTFIALGKQLGFSREHSRRAFRYGLNQYLIFLKKRKELGRKFQEEIEADRSRIGIVLFGRAYNAFAKEANLGIPQKFASKGIPIIPFECLDYDGMPCTENMTWAVGREIIQAAHLVKDHPQLFGVYITNFSCGPDSFLVGYFRDIMKTKPSLTLELDSHSADAGINTRIEAFLDIVDRFIKLGLEDPAEESFTPAKVVVKDGKPFYVSSDNKTYSLKDRRVKMLVPSMGRTSAELASAAFRGVGFNSAVVPLPDFGTLMLGRENTSCKECLPLILTTGSLLEAVKRRESDDELILYFMPTTSGSCRFAQYYVFLKRLVKKRRIKNVAFLTLTTENGYAGMGALDMVLVLKSIIVADIMDDIKNTISVLAADKESAMKIFDEGWQRIIRCFEGKGKGLYKVLEAVSKELSKIELKIPISKAKKVLLVGEIYVRRDEFSSQMIIDRLGKKGIVVHRAPMLEWLHYVDYIVKHIHKNKLTLKERGEFMIRQFIQRSIEKRVKGIFSKSGIYEAHLIDMNSIMNRGSVFINPKFTGESIVNVGSFFHEIISHVHGVISVGPFGCMPTRVVESILTTECNTEHNSRLCMLPNHKLLSRFPHLPFLSVESDGNPFPQIIESRIEAFSVQVERVYETLNKDKEERSKENIRSSA